jgi:hypothetical protein
MSDQYTTPINMMSVVVTIGRLVIGGKMQEKDWKNDID